jgi:hypothetical protein
MTDVITESTEHPLYSQANQKIRLIREATLVLEKSGREYFKATRPEKQK